MAERVCSIEGCGHPVRCKHLCSIHYERLRTRGTLELSRKGAAWKYLKEVVLSYEGDDCLIWPFAKFSNGYAQVSIGKPKKKLLAHRLICRRVHGQPPTPAHEAAHSCGQGGIGCVTPNHLRWALHVDNEADKLRHGTLARGEKNGRHKLTERDVQQIRMLSGMLSQRNIALRFGISQTTVSDIVTGRKWSWLA